MNSSVNSSIVPITVSESRFVSTLSSFIIGTPRWFTIISSETGSMPSPKSRWWARSVGSRARTSSQVAGIPIPSESRMSAR